MNVTNEMVDRFMCWKLPVDFHPDAGVSFNPGHITPATPWWPTGTNLLTADQAKAMLEHVLGVVDGYCTEGERCVCGGDTPRVRSGCANWVTPNK